ncbi:MAG: cytochrome c oxidase subunit II [Betaproteobacteria bacterium]|nr:cytochrome c oxidase subunit II [Betaproteobacteria bacterium]
MRKTVSGALCLLFGILVWAPARAFEINLKPPASPIAEQIYGLHIMVLWVCLGIFIVVFGAMLYAIVNHRKSVGHKPALFHENLALEVVWTIIPFLILAGMAYPATRTVLAMKNTAGSALSIEVTGYQWKWQYTYLPYGISFFSTLSTPPAQLADLAPKNRHYLEQVDHPMVVPTGEKIRLLVTSADVVHSWFVPALGVKQDAFPGFIKATWFEADAPGVYRGYCTELCGKGHAFMPIVVDAVTPAQFAAWVAAEQRGKKTAATAAAKAQASRGHRTLTASRAARSS